MGAPTIVAIGTLDTKGPELQYIRERVEALGGRAVVVDSGILGEPGCQPDVTRSEVAAAAGHDLAAIRDAGSRGAAVEMMQVGVREVVLRAYREGKLDGVLCLGGAEGALLGAFAMQALPVGIPKLIVSPSASGPRAFGPFVGRSDVMVMHSVIDILGLNAISRAVFDNAVAAVMGMVREAGRPASELGRQVVGITMLGQTTPGVMALVPLLEEAGWEPVIFHANGVGGPAMEDLIAQGAISAVIEYSLSELANGPFEGIHATGPSRLTVAAEHGLPQIVIPGCADFFNQGPLEEVPEKFRDRLLYRHNPVATLVRLKPREMAELGRTIATRLAGANGPVEVVAPTEGFSLIGVEGGPLRDNAGDLALIDALEDELGDEVPVTRVELPINHPDLARTVAERFGVVVAARGKGDP